MNRDQLFAKIQAIIDDPSFAATMGEGQDLLRLVNLIPGKALVEGDDGVPLVYMPQFSGAVRMSWSRSLGDSQISILMFTCQGYGQFQVDFRYDSPDSPGPSVVWQLGSDGAPKENYLSLRIQGAQATVNSLFSGYFS